MPIPDQLLNQQGCFAAFAPIQRADINTGHHTVLLGFLITNHEDFTVSLLKVQTFHHVPVVSCVLNRLRLSVRLQPGRRVGRVTLLATAAASTNTCLLWGEVTCPLGARAVGARVLAI